NDRVTFRAGRAAFVWVDGVAKTLTVGTPVHLDGGELTALADGTYRVNWNTGESVTVTDEGSFLNVRAGLGANDTAGTVVGCSAATPARTRISPCPTGRCWRRR